MVETKGEGCEKTKGYKKTREIYVLKTEDKDYERKE